MLGVVKNNEFQRLVKLSAKSGDIGSQSTYTIVRDVDAHYAQAIGAGAEIVIDIEEDINGERSYSCRDLQGQIWNFSGYVP